MVQIYTEEAKDCCLKVVSKFKGGWNGDQNNGRVTIVWWLNRLQSYLFRNHWTSGYWRLAKSCPFQPYLEVVGYSSLEIRLETSRGPSYQATQEENFQIAFLEHKVSDKKYLTEIGAFRIPLYSESLIGFSIVIDVFNIFVRILSCRIEFL